MLNALCRLESRVDRFLSSSGVDFSWPEWRRRIQPVIKMLEKYGWSSFVVKAKDEMLFTKNCRSLRIIYDRDGWLKLLREDSTESVSVSDIEELENIISGRVQYSKGKIEEILVEDESVDAAYTEFMNAYQKKDGKWHGLGFIKTHMNEELIHQFFRDLVVRRDPELCNEEFTPKVGYTPATIKFTNEAGETLYVYFRSCSENYLSCMISSTLLEFRRDPDR